MSTRAPTHQTVRLARGKHSSPDKGACVMELASMLAGEDFSDYPATVCPVIGGFLRHYNDALDDARRQDLYPVASAIVGTATSDETVTAARVRLIANWGRTHAWARRRRWFARGPRTAIIDESSGRDVGGAAVRAVRRIDDAAHAGALEMLDRLVALPVTSPAAPPSARAAAPRLPAGRP